MPVIEPPSSDEVKFFSANLKLSPAANAKIQALMEQTGLTKAKTFGALLEISHAAIANDTALVAKWVAYIAAVKKSRNSAA